MLPEAENQNGLPPVIDTTIPKLRQEFLREIEEEKVFFVDLDETMGRTVEAFQTYVWQFYKAHFEFENMTKYGVNHALTTQHQVPDDMARQITARAFADARLYNIIEPYEAVLRLVETLWAEDYKIYVITHRVNVENNAPGLTQNWLARNGVQCEGVIFCDQDEKAKLIAEAAAVVKERSAFLDDRPETFKKTVERLPDNSNIEAYLMDRPWNRENGHENVVTAEKLQQLLLEEI